MKFTSTAIAALFAVTSTASAVLGSKQLVSKNALAEPASEIVQLNLTQIEELQSGLAKRDDYDWFALFYSSQNCGGSFVDGWAGKGTSGCNKIAATAYSMNWIPGSSGLPIRASTTEGCTGAVQCGDNNGCQNFRANIQQSGVDSFSVGCSGGV